MKEINHLDLFSGIGGFHMGFERAGFKINSYFSEIDKHAIAVYKHQFPNSTYVGSVTNVRGGDLPKIDLITFGSPCQDFSLAGKRAGMEGERSSLILEAVRLIHECRPSVFVWENVKGAFSSNDGADFWAIIQTFANIGGYRLEWQLLNTSWFLPQNRERIYLVGYSSAPKRGWRGVFPIARETKESNGIRVRGQLPGGQLGRVLDTEGHGYALSACDYKDPMKVVVGAYRGRYNADGTTSQQLEVNENGTYIGERELTPQVKQIDTNLPFIIDVSHKNDGIRYYSEHSPTLAARDYKDPRMVITPGTWRTHKDGQGFRAVQGDDAPTIPARAREDGSGQPVVKVENQISRIAHLGTGGQKGFVHSVDGISPCINATEYTDPMKVAVKSEVRPVQIGQSEKTFAAQNGTLIGKENQDAFTIRAANPNGVMVEEEPNYTIGDLRYDEGGFRPRNNGIAPSVVGSSKKSGTPNCSMLLDNTNFRIRRLTPIETERLQGFPDNHTAFGNYDGEVKPMSNTQRYKQCGNAVTVDVVQAVAERCYDLF